MANAPREGNTVWLVTGASNGLGAAFLPPLLSRPATTVIALHRAASAVADFSASSIHPTSAIYTHHYDAKDTEQDVSRLAEDLRTEHGIERVHVVLASAGMVDGMKPALSTGWDEVQKHMNVNFGGPLKLVQGLKGLLGLDTTTRSPTVNGPKFILISSSVGSLGTPEPVPGCLAYGSSKAAANYLITRLHLELAAQDFTAVAVHPGWVRTRMGWHAADQWGASRDIVPLSPEESATAVLKVVDEATREKSGGKFLSYDGSEMAW
ncbi:uncharacterized protein A1O9_12520 [Exophiala aquamarina CBS 119918]|uniref:Uncharacterized protein n=1 Tax=Exophiala aquamarina CBS 119918 TaxID=1182545 RepID=A0A072NUT0_9EURO|nr:uncharacterized protein A1O9_12520 [Exophiala aquamarina CBS 119918]KEF51371.1 hypothetical protein A1O9_12520 [Exophiala aquamarina CBS 119918]